RARGDAQPGLSLSYDAHASVGYAGVGWTLDVPSIERRGAAGMPKFVDDPLSSDPLGDRYFFDGAPLVPVCQPTSETTTCDGEVGSGRAGWTYFRTELDDGMRFFFSPAGDRWEIERNDGVTLVLGVPSDGLPNPTGVVWPVETQTKLPPGATTDAYRWALSRQH